MIYRGILMLAALLGCTPAPSELSQRPENYEIGRAHV